MTMTSKLEGTAMPTLEELYSEKVALEKKKLELETYLSRYRRNYSERSGIIYLANSPTDGRYSKSIDYKKTYEFLQDERRKLKKECGMTLRQIEDALKEYNSSIAAISREIEAMEKKDSQEPDSSYYRIFGDRQRASGLKVQLTENRTGSFTGQVQEEPVRNDCNTPDGHGNQLSYSDLYKQHARKGIKPHEHSRNGKDR